MSTECTYSVDIFKCLKLLRVRPLSETQDGCIGIRPPMAQPGDVACVLLGYKVPILLRSDSTVINKGFTVIGEFYVHGLDDGVTLLGPLPPDWRIQLGKGLSGSAAMQNLRTDGVAEDDARLAALSEEWSKVNRGRDPDDPALFQTYENSQTGEEINCDPRLTSNELRRRGVKLQRFIQYQDMTVSQ